MHKIFLQIYCTKWVLRDLRKEMLFPFTWIKLMYCLTKKELKYSSLIEKKICFFLQKETSHCKKSLALGPHGPKNYIFSNHFYSKNDKKLRFHVFLLFHVRKHIRSSFYLKWTEFTRNFEFCSNCGSQRTQIKLEQIYNFLWGYHMFSSIKMEDYMKPELSGIFWVKMVAKNIVLGSPRTHFVHMRLSLFCR